MRTDCDKDEGRGQATATTTFVLVIDKSRYQRFLIQLYVKPSFHVIAHDRQNH